MSLPPPLLRGAIFTILPLVAAWFMILAALHHEAPMGVSFWAALVAVWLMAWYGVDQLANATINSKPVANAVSLIIPVIFGLWLLILWQIITTGFKVPGVLLPPPSAIGARFASSIPTLWADFRQTLLTSFPSKV
ncbi:MAG TPA: hypothetical protein ENJ57_06755 [Rhizobiales bacterium]|nr:hypothetical protein [Hyphomicrobiales bacterium]